ncbi:MAG TPA: CBS domain-containing protein [Aggregicoccus sp.]|nr:CBS domain-containing protein [Aggregicoccus sp.]
MAHKQPDFRQNPSTPNRGASTDNPRTDEVIGRFQSASTHTPSTQEETTRRGSGPGRFFRAASERLKERFGGRGSEREEWGTASQGYRAEGPSEPFLRGMREGSYRDDSRAFDDQRTGAARYGRAESGAGFDVDVDPSFERSAERSYGRGFGAERGFSERGFDESQTRYRQTPGQEARDIQRRGYPQASYAGGGELREERGQYTDLARREGGYQAEQRRGRWQREPFTAKEIMTRNPRTVRRESPLRDAAQIMKDENVGIVPVVDESNHLVGVLTDRDLVVRAFVDEKDPSSLRVSQVMTDDVEAVTPDESIHGLIELMGRKQIRRVPVVDREDRLLGIIAMADIANRAEQDDELQDALERISARRSFWNRL